MKKSYDVSVITPIFNASRYLAKYFNTLKKQSSNKLNIQILIVDDASTDNSLKLIKNFNFKNVTLIKLKSNMGVSAARNIGIKNALGNYIFFFDIDDSIEDNSLEFLFQKAKIHNSDFIFSDHKRIENLNDQRKNKYDFAKETIFNKKKIVFSMSKEFINPNTGHLGLFGCNGRLIKRSLLIDNNLFFDENLRWNEDKTFAWRVLSFVKKAVYVRKKLYSYYVRPNLETGSVIGLSRNFSLKNIKRISMHINESLKTIGFKKKEFENLKSKILAFHAIKVLISLTIRLKLNKIEYKKGELLRKKIIKDIINDHKIRSAIKKYKPSPNESYFLPKAISFGSIYFIEFFCNLRANKIINLRRNGKV
jgi:glycosyltransferase involved in cell wall biosynthesis